MNDAVLFRSDAFSLEPTPEGDQVYDLPLGDDLAAALRERLLQRNTGLWIDAPIREDWGTVLWLKDGAEHYYIYVHWIPGENVENQWGLTFSKPRGLIGALLRRPSGPEQCRWLQTLVAQVLAEDPQTFRAVEWLSQVEFDARM